MGYVSIFLITSWRFSLRTDLFVHQVQITADEFGADLRKNQTSNYIPDISIQFWRVG